ncbi:MAG: hypothetical protein WBF84_18485 [Castellaniella sp.]|uniref:hypothetical protein n=1 Tax=Castellaniella sp. TaxID=1955812 RepID=UPI003C70C8D3
MSADAFARLRWSRLGPQDRDRIFELHLRVLRDMSPDQVRPESLEFFEALLDGAGRIIGACDPDGGLVAYGVLQDGPDPGTRPDLWLDWPSDARIQKLAGSSVAQAYRGQRLQCELIRRRVALADPGAYLYATAAPSNPASWHSLLYEGFEIRRLRRVYQDSLRYLLARRAGPPIVSADADASRPMDALSLDAQDRLLSQGWRGRFLARTGAVFVPPEVAGP